MESFANASAGGDLFVHCASRLERARNHGNCRERLKQALTTDDWLTQTDAELLAQCRLERFRVSGPGGQHRNKTDSAVRLTHLPSGIQGYASERRSQHQNRSEALKRLRREIALQRRRPIELKLYHPPAELQRILPRGVRADQPQRTRVGPRHQDFWSGVRALLDLLEATDGAVSDAAALLGCSTGQFVKLLNSEPHLWAAANAIRERHDLKPLRR